MRKIQLLACMLVVCIFSLASAQDVARAVMGVLGEELGTAITVDLPNYGRHAIVKLALASPTPEEARAAALPVFTALTNSAAQVVSVSIHGSTGFMEPEYVLVFQRRADGSILVFLNGEPY